MVNLLNIADELSLYLGINDMTALYNKTEEELAPAMKKRDASTS